MGGWADADVVWACSLCFSDELLASVVTLAAQVMSRRINEPITEPINEPTDGRTVLSWIQEACARFFFVC